MNSNYPLVRLTGAGGRSPREDLQLEQHEHPHRCDPGVRGVRLPAVLPAPVTLVVVGNGFASDPTTLPATATPFCFGDGTDQLCPCFNDGTTGHGCENSASTGGSRLVLSGTPSLSADTAVFTASGELPTALSVLVQGTTSIFPANYGDGLRCVSGTLKRLFVKSASGGVVMLRRAAIRRSRRAPRLSAIRSRAGRPAYQVYHRDPDPIFCASPVGARSSRTRSRSRGQ
jgi:hypothetical protein